MIDNIILARRRFAFSLFHFFDLLQYFIIHFPFNFTLFVELICLLSLVFDGFVLFVLARLCSLYFLLDLLFLAPKVNRESDEAENKDWN